MSKPTHDVVATTGEYQSQGETKKRYVTIGKCFTDDQGRQSIKLDSIPVGPGWSGWVSLYPVREREPAGQRPDPRPAAPKPAHRGDEPVDDDDVPF